MSLDISKRSVLCLDGLWMVRHTLTIQQAMIAMTGGVTTDSALGMDIEYELNKEGIYDFSSMPNLRPVEWEEWKALRIRPYDQVIHTKSDAIRVPTVVINCHYRGAAPMLFPRATSRAIMERDEYTCQITGQKLPKSQLNIDHVTPKSRGGRDSWENQVTMRKDINFDKGHKTNEEAGIKLIRSPRAPKGIPLGSQIKIPKDDLGRDWRWFIKNKK